jgi:hypothetical protein
MTTTASTPMTAAQDCELTDLPALPRRFQTWRASRVRGQRIPAELWQAAIAVARVHGINPTVAALKLNYYDLQRRLAGGTARHDGCAPAPVFVELPAGSMCSGAGERGGVELVRAGGSRLIVHRGSVGSDELLAVVKLFLRHGR